MSNLHAVASLAPAGTPDDARHAPPPPCALRSAVPAVPYAQASSQMDVAPPPARWPQGPPHHQNL